MFSACCVVNLASSFDIHFEDACDVLWIYFQQSFNAVDSGAGKRPSSHFVDLQGFRKCRNCLGNFLFEGLSRGFIFG